MQIEEQQRLLAVSVFQDIPNGWQWALAVFLMQSTLVAHYIYYLADALCRPDRNPLVQLNNLEDGRAMVLLMSAVPVQVVLSPDVGTLFGGAFTDELPFWLYMFNERPELSTKDRLSTRKIRPGIGELRLRFFMSAVSSQVYAYLLFFTLPLVVVLSDGIAISLTDNFNPANATIADEITHLDLSDLSDLSAMRTILAVIFTAKLGSIIGRSRVICIGDTAEDDVDEVDDDIVISPMVKACSTSAVRARRGGGETSSAMISVSTPRKSATVDRSQIREIKPDADVGPKQEATPAEGEDMYQDMYSATKKPASEPEESSDDGSSSASSSDSGGETEIAKSTPTKGNVSINAFRPIKQFNGHKHGILSVATTSQGHIGSGSADRTARIWVDGTKPIATLTGHEDGVAAVAFSPDGERVVTAGWDHRVFVWSAVSGEQIIELKGHGAGVNAADFSADGKQVATGSADLSARIFDATSGKLLRDIDGHDSWLTCVKFSPDGAAKLATGSADNTARIVDASDGKLLFELKEHTDRVQSLAFAPDGGALATASFDCMVMLWSVETGQKLLAFQAHGSGISAIAFSPRGSYIASGAADMLARVWDASTGKQHREFKGHESIVTSVAFMDETRLVTGSWDKTVRVWSLES